MAFKCICNTLIFQIQENNYEFIKFRFSRLAHNKNKNKKVLIKNLIKRKKFISILWFHKIVIKKRNSLKLKKNNWNLILMKLSWAKETLIKFSLSQNEIEKNLKIWQFCFPIKIESMKLYLNNFHVQ